MRYPTLILYLSLAALPVSSFAAGHPAPAQAAPAPHVWDNDDLVSLRAKGLISTFSPAEPAAQPQQQVEPYDRTKDPAWYADRATELRDELDKLQAQLDQLRDGLSAVQTDQQTTGGIALDRGNIGITPEAGIAITESQVQQVQSRLDDLDDLARQNDIPPGVLRG